MKVNSFNSFSFILITFLVVNTIAKDPKTMKEDIINILNQMHQPEIYQDFFDTYSGKKYNDPGFLNFYYQDISEKDFLIHEKEKEGEYEIGERDNNPNVKKQKISHDYMIDRKSPDKRQLIFQPSTEFITIHDTGNDGKGANALAHARFVTTGTGKVSWHFTIDENDIYQHLPLDEVGKHAGDGNHTFKLLDTGVKYTIENPKIEFKAEDNYLYVNNEKSLLKTVCEDDVCHYIITEAGLYTEKGENGNYWINNYYYNKDYDRISNGGGNQNSVGIESCIDEGTSYSKTMRKLSNLVCRLLNHLNLNPTRVLQHRNFSGKHCPGSMIIAKEKKMFSYKMFKKYVETEYLILKNLPNAKFTYISKNPELLTNEGQILKYVDKQTEVDYEVTVEYNGVIVTQNYKTIIHPVGEE